VSELFKLHEKTYMKEGTPTNNLYVSSASRGAFKYQGTTLQYAVSGTEEQLEENTYLCDPDVQAQEFRTFKVHRDIWQIK
jgi:hypothetical protein